MNSKALPQALGLAGLGLSLSACVITAGSRRYEDDHEPLRHMHAMHLAAAQDRDDEDFEEVEQGQEQGEEAGFEYEIAKLEFKRSMFQVSVDLDAARFGLQTAQAELEDAERALASFDETAKVRIDEAELDLDSSIGDAADAALELAELKAMYDEEDFAEKTKELVLQRGRRNLEESQRSLAIAREEHRQLLELELPGEQRDLEWELSAAKIALKAAARELDMAELGSKIDSMQAKHDLEEALQEAQADS